jgi:uncharacterized small protein (DUF1192 family)
MLSFHIPAEVDPIRLVIPATLRETRDRVTATRSVIFNSPHYIHYVSTNSTQFAMSVTEIEQRCNLLRNDLKAWEKKFAAQHHGRKAGRDDIKANEEICMHATQHLSKAILAYQM